MKKIIFSILSLGFVLGLSSCQPEINLPETSAQPITSVTATVKYKGEYLSFTAYPEEGSNIIEIEFPWFYPINSDNRLPMSVLSEAKMTAELANNVVITEPLLYMDLSQLNEITVIDQMKKEHKYTITGKISKLNLCDLTEFVLSDEIGLSALVKDQTSQIAILTDGLAGKGGAIATISPHATISPDPATEEIDFDDPDLVFTVTAHNGKDKRQYTIIKEIPPKREFGLRPDCGKVIFAKQIYGELGVDVADKTTGLAVNGANLVINTIGQNPIYIDRYTGEKKGTMSIGELATSGINQYMTSDDAGNIFFCNNQPTDEAIFKIWKAKDVNSTPEEYITLQNIDAKMIGRKFSVAGSIDADAVISLPILGPSSTSFYRWVVKDGELVSQEPELISVTSGIAWTYNCDITYVDGNPESDYFIHGYAGRQLMWVTGATNTLNVATDPTSVNFIANSVDVIKFNRGTYLATSQLNSFDWGGADLAWLIDIASAENFSGTLDADYYADKLSPKCESILWQAPYNTYGARAIAGTVGASYLDKKNSGEHSDIILAPSTENDYYMYMYFMFCNGYVVGVQFDCLDM